MRKLYHYLSGFNIFLITGGMQDFNYVRSNCFEITFELSCCKYPEASTLPGHWKDNKDALIRYLELANMGIHGKFPSYLHHY